MYCQDCGNKLTLKFCENEGLVPYCNVCDEFKFPPFKTAGLNAVKYKYMSSRYHEPRNVLMLNFIVVLSEGEVKTNPEEILEAQWCDFDRALELIHHDSVAEFFLKNAVAELKKNKI